MSAGLRERFASGPGFGMTGDEAGHSFIPGRLHYQLPMIHRQLIYRKAPNFPVDRYSHQAHEDIC